MGRLTRFWDWGLIRAGRKPSEYRHDDQPSACELVIADDGVSVIDRSGGAESSEQIVRRNWTVKDFSGLLESRSFFGKDCHPRVHDLDDMVRTDS
jgi:hypothetical protein